MNGYGQRVIHFNALPVTLNDKDIPVSNDNRISTDILLNIYIPKQNGNILCNLFPTLKLINPLKDDSY